MRVLPFLSNRYVYISCDVAYLLLYIKRGSGAKRAKKILVKLLVYPHFSYNFWTALASLFSLISLAVSIVPLLFVLAQILWLQKMFLVRLDLVGLFRREVIVRQWLYLTSGLITWKIRKIKSGIWRKYHGVWLIGDTQRSV